MARGEAMARMIVSIVALASASTLTACERFAHPKYDPPQYAPGNPGTAGGGGADGSTSSSAPRTGDDITVPGCAVVAGGAGGIAEGSPCTAARDCAIVCCSCNGNGAGAGNASGAAAAAEWSAASCVDGVCATQATTCGRTSACGAGGVILVAGGSSGGAPAACAGGNYADPTCDACMAASCCAQEEACANDASCGAVESCVGECSDSACVASCEAIYGASSAAANLDACYAASCVSACP